MKYDPLKTEKRWQRYWESKKLHQAKDSVRNRSNFMLLTEFPYPSGNLHIGHWYTFAVSDILARYLRMTGKNVMYPIGFDAFGLPAENAAIKNKISPELWTKKNIAFMTKQLLSMGAMFDWSRVVSTIDPEYYKWTQWMFLKFYEKDLAYRAKTKVNWCPKDKTVLANEQVIQKPRANSQEPIACCERCNTPVEQRELEQWMYKISEYADRLIDDMEGLDWPETTKLAQQNWIGRSRGAHIKFSLRGISGQADDKHVVEVFTTRADTIFGATFIVISPETAKFWLDIGWQALDSIRQYVKQSLSKRELERQEQKEKTGVVAGIRAVNPLSGEEIPVWIADYVLGGYGTGAIMAVPAHDQRDWEFAQKFKLPIKMVICSNYPEEKCPVLENAYEGEGHLVGSGKFDGMSSQEAGEKITQELKNMGSGSFKTTYRLRDWVLSRQRYWGCPIPMIRCADCGHVPVPEKELPVKLPPLKDFHPTDDGRSPLAKAEKWVKVQCPKCKGNAERETDTMDTFVDSSWYFIRYADSKNKKEFADTEKISKWLPVPMYVGGAEHNTMHLLYSRFFIKALYDLGYVKFNEPFVGRRNHGIILGPDGQKMSKSRGNVVDPDELVKRYGADVVRLHLAFMAPYDQGGPWNPRGINGIIRFVQRVWKLFEDNSKIKNQKSKLQIKNQKFESNLHKAIKKIGEDISGMRYNTAVSELMKLLNAFETTDYRLPTTDYSIFLKLLAPFTPHLTEEIWSSVLKNKKSIHLEPWPEYDPKLLVEDTLKIPVQINGKIRDVLDAPADVTETRIRELALSSENVKRHLKGEEIKKFIYIPKKMVSIVV